MAASKKGQLPVENRQVPLDSVIREISDLLAPRFQKANGELVLGGEKDLEVLGDDNGLEIMLTNLIENALKYGGSPPRVKIFTAKQGKNAAITISDNGKGILKSERKAVFRQFYRSEGRLDDGQTGAGLGLAICGRLAKLMNGSLDLGQSDDPAYGGASFTLFIPLSQKLPS